MKKPTVLLVDDEAIVRDSISEWLKGDGFEVECATGGQDALEQITRKRFDTAVVDLKMPGIDGLEVMNRVRQIAPQTLVIIITAYGTVENAVDAMKKGASDYLRKPFTPDDLEKVIEDAFKRAHNPSAQVTTIESPQPEVEEEPVVEVKEKPKAKPEKQCIWSKAGVVSYRLCTNNFKCDSCEFAQTLMDKGTEVGNRPMMMDAIKKMVEKPGPERPCRYMLSGDVSHKLCPNVYQCYKCAFDQQMQLRLDEKTEKTMAKLKTRLGKKANEN